MASKTYKPAKLFTIEEANARLPLVRAIVADMMQLARELMDRSERLRQLAAGRTRGSTDVYRDELEQVQMDLDRDSDKLQGYIDELMALGVEPKSATEGLVDFPSMVDGRLAYLCWRYNEPEVLYWHDLEAGFAGRQPLTAASAVAGDPSVDSYEV